MTDKQDRRIAIRRTEDYKKGVVFGQMHKDLDNIKKGLAQVLKILQGDDCEGGVVTQVQVNSRNIKLIWGLISVQFLSLVALFIKVIME